MKYGLRLDNKIKVDNKGIKFMEANILIMSSRSCGKKHVSYNTVLGLEDEFSNCILKSMLWTLNTH